MSMGGPPAGGAAAGRGGRVEVMGVGTKDGAAGCGSAQRVSGCSKTVCQHLGTHRIAVDEVSDEREDPSQRRQASLPRQAQGQQTHPRGFLASCCEIGSSSPKTLARLRSDMVERKWSEAMKGFPVTGGAVGCTDERDSPVELQLGLALPVKRGQRMWCRGDFLVAPLDLRHLTHCYKHAQDACVLLRLECFRASEPARPAAAARTRPPP